MSSTTRISSSLPFADGLRRLRGLGLLAYQGDAGQAHPELRALVLAEADGLDAAAVHLGQPPRQRQADAQTALCAVEATLALCEQVEDARQQFVIDADALVAHA